MDSIICRITVYKYGKKFTPVKIKKKKRNCLPLDGKLNCDRPALISKIHHLLAIHGQEAKKAHNQVTIYTPDYLKIYYLDAYSRSPRSHCSHNIHREMQQAIRHCYEERINESQLYPVGELFMELFRCQQNTKSLFSPLLNNTATCLTPTGIHILYPLSDMQNANAAFEYYLQHVCCARQHLYQTENNIINQEIEENSGILPLSAALQKRDPSLVLTLLRYGAYPFETLESYEEHMRNPTEQILDDLNGLFLFKNTSFSAQICTELAAEEAKAWKCLMFIRRSVPCIQMDCSTFIRTSSHIDSDTEEDESESLPVCPFPKYSMLPKLVETIDMDLFKVPSTLKHLCRCAVRKRLGQNWRKVSSIPKGIQSLPLPQRMKEYLDLLCD